MKLKKRGLITLLATTAVVGVGIGSKTIIKKINEQKEKREEDQHLKELEDDAFDDLFEE